MLSSFIVFTLFTMACALAPNWPAFLIFRLICGINASSAIAVVGGLYADVFADPVIRGRAMAAFMAVGGNVFALHRTQADNALDHDSRSAISPHNIRLRLYGRLALDILGWLNLRWSLAHLPSIPSGNLRTHHPQTSSPKDAQRNR